MDTTNSIDHQLLDLADKINAISEVKDYRANLLNEVTINENSHSRFLRLLLSYNVKGTYPFYSSFLAIDKIAKVLTPEIKIGKPEFVNEWARIDLLVKAHDYAIIIENKIYNAVDQDTQIQRYIDFCLKCGYSKDQIIVLYLTNDGTKKVSDWSLTEKAKEILTSGGTCRFVEINFKHDIRTWIKESLIPFVREDNDEMMLSALIQYSDYLDEMFDDGFYIQENNSEIMDSLNNLGINTLSCLKETIDKLYLLQTKLDGQFQILLPEQLNQYIMKPLEEYCMNNNAKATLEKYGYDKLEIRISLPGLSKSSFCISQQYVGICSWDGNGEDQITEEAVWREFNRNDYKTYPDSPWWVVLKPSTITNIGTKSFWDNDVPTLSIVKDIIKQYEEVRRIVSGEIQ